MAAESTCFGVSTKIIISILTVAVFGAVSAAIIITVLVLPDPDPSEDIPIQSINSVWRWECINKQCEKVLITDETLESALSVGACKMFCNDFGNIWPRPTGTFEKGNSLIQLNRYSVDVIVQNSGPAADLMRSAARRFVDHIIDIPPLGGQVNAGGRTLTVNVKMNNFTQTSLTLETDESYSLTLNALPDNRLQAEVIAENFFGARHALETLEQFVIYDDIRSEVQIIQDLFIEDQPVYPYRGILLDTSRNFYTVESIKRTLDAMGACKLNTFHWHITDSHSFSFISKSHPELSRLGAISPYKVYTEAQIRDIVQYGIERGVRVMPEFDAPAHVGEGWQETNLTVCFKAEPWQEYCVEPPCGQFDVTKDELYVVLQGIYNDLFDLFSPDIFHMGGDEVHDHCWNSSTEITDWMQNQGWGLEEVDFFKLWDYFQFKAKENVYKANKGKKLPIIMWTSTLTQFNQIEQYLPNDEYIIQVWTTGTDPEIEGLLSKGYRLIMSNYDALYLDCGFGAWVGEGNNWCSPYIGWQKVYNNSPKLMAGNNTHLILGGEAALWSEQADTSTLDSRLWPRAGALAERLWAEPDETWISAERRMLQFRERLIRIGIAADSLQPEWCYQNDGYCYL